jgi:hypothetical protein
MLRPTKRVVDGRDIQLAKHGVVLGDSEPWPE